ncbi:MAG TPA: NlpC/P60 family protein [Streptosporangiaceae bacterium]|nr:NlpC/P60 family protein [Streptosporangiaceae bacterium]
MHKPLSVRRAGRYGWIVVASLATAAAVVSMGGSAAAFPAPTVSQVQHELTTLNNRASRLGQQYDVVQQELSLASQRLNLLNKETKRYRSTFDSMRSQLGRIAAVSYEQGGADTPLALLTSNSPQQVLNQSSILGELSAVDASQISQYLVASRQLLDAQQAASRERTGILQLSHSLHKRLAALNALKAQAETLLAQLSPAQRTGVGPGSGSGTKQKYTGSTKTQAGKAVQFAYNALGCPYVYGATGPCSSGFDCSGLMLAAWASAGISIPRVSWDQMSSLPAVALHNSSGAFTTAYLEPGDILGFAGNSHVGMYVGGNEVIDAPVPGASVEKVSLTGWYLQELDGAVRP